MFTTLVESRARRARNGKSTTLSLLVHGALIAGLAALTTTPDVEANPAPKPIETIYRVPVSEPLRPAVPRSPSSPPAPADRPHIPIGMPANITIPASPTFDVNFAPAPAENAFIGKGINDPAAQPTGVGDVSPLGTGREIIASEMTDRPPRVAGSAPVPRYPGILRETGTAGHVTVRFVIDTLGRVEAGSVAITETTHALFADAVRSALPSYRFSAGEAGGRKVRTLVQMPFTFAIR